MQRFGPTLLFVFLALGFLWRSTIGGHALLPGDYLEQMQPWKVSREVAAARQWDPIQWDALAQFYPWRAFYARSVREGTLPLWNPHQFCGTPFAANAQSAVFYPPNLIFALISPEAALGWSAALHLFLAGLFTFLLIRGLGVGRFGAYVGGITYAFGAFMITWLELPSLVNSAAWLPLALLLIHKAAHSGRTAPAAGAGLALAMAVLAGHLQVALYVLLMAGGWWAWLIAQETLRTRRIGRQVALAVLTFAVALLIAAPQILPALELSGFSHRAREATADGFARFQDNSVPARNLITALVPDFFGSPARGDYWGGVPYAEHALYIGVLPLMLALLGGIYGIRRGRHASFFVAVAALSILSAFGAYINALFYYVMPGAPALGGPNRIIVLYTLSAAVLAGIGADWFAGLCSREEAPACERDFARTFRPALIVVSLVAALYVGAFIIAVAYFQRLGPVDLQILLGHIRPQLAIFGALFIGGTLLLLLRGLARLPRQAFAGLAFALILADLFAFGIGYNPTSPRGLVSPDNPAVREICELVGEERIMPLNSDWSLYQTPRAVIPPNLAMLYGLYDVQGYDSLFSRGYKEFVDRLQGQDSSPMENGNILFFKAYDRQAARLARFIISPRQLDDPEGLRLVRADGLYIYENPDAQPFASMTDGDVRILHRGPNEITLDVLARRPGEVVVAQSFYPGWRGYVGGSPTRVSQAEGIFQAVSVPEGRHEVRFSFEPASVRRGYWLAGFGLLLALGALLMPARGRKP